MHVARASIDGCRTVGIFTRIIFPLIAPALITFQKYLVQGISTTGPKG